MSPGRRVLFATRMSTTDRCNARAMRETETSSALHGGLVAEVILYFHSSGYVEVIQ